MVAYISLGFGPFDRASLGFASPFDPFFASRAKPTPYGPYRLRPEIMTDKHRLFFP